MNSPSVSILCKSAIEAVLLIGTMEFFNNSILFLKIEKLSQHLQITIFVSPILNILSHYFIAEIQLTRVLNCKNSYSSSEF